jgi:hypothetical protein
MLRTKELSARTNSEAKVQSGVSNSKSLAPSFRQKLYCSDKVLYARFSNGGMCYEVQGAFVRTKDR